MFISKICCTWPTSVHNTYYNNKLNIYTIQGARAIADFFSDQIIGTNIIIWKLVNITILVWRTHSQKKFRPLHNGFPLVGFFILFFGSYKKIVFFGGGGLLYGRFNLYLITLKLSANVDCRLDFCEHSWQKKLPPPHKQNFSFIAFKKSYKDFCLAASIFIRPLSNLRANVD